MNKFSEDNQVEQPAIELFLQLNWRIYNAFDEVFGNNGNLGRESSKDVVLVNVLRERLLSLNKEIPSEQIEVAIKEITRDRSSLQPVKANQQVYNLLRDGVDVSFRNSDGKQIQRTIKIIDWQNSENNDFLLVSQLWVSGEMHRRRPDLVGFINGIPLLLFELKKPSRRLYEAFHDNLSDYKDAIPQLFWFNQIIFLSNGSDTKVGSITAPWEHFNEWKKISDEEEPGIISLETAIRGICDKERLLDLLENYVLFKSSGGVPQKLLAKNHQFLGVNNAIQAVRHIEKNKGKLGVFWHTQGSGKSFSMVFFTRKIMRSLTGNWKFLIVTDRLDLDDQIYKNFASVGAVTEPEMTVRADSKEQLQQLLRENHRYVFTLIQKFHSRDNQEFPVLSGDDDIIVMTDEAHRTQYDVLAMNMRKALPNAAFLGFTGTPLIKGEDERTREVFGEYVSVYDFKQSIEDGATVPLFYENRIPELQLTNDNLNEEMAEILDDANLSEKQEEKLERQFRQEYHLLTRNDRLETIAEDIVDHFLNRGYMGKGLFIALDRFTAIRMYDLVQKYWHDKLQEFKVELKTASSSRRNVLLEKIHYIDETDMAVMISQSQNEIRDFEAKGLDIKKHRLRIEKEPLDEMFKNDENPLRLVFVCAMWITGFDVPSLSTLYLDKPMKSHTLMQTIARANRVFEGKNNGLIVDYVGVFRNLQQALAIYATGKDEGSDNEAPVQDKEKLVEQLEEAISEAKQFCKKQGVDLEKIIQAKGFEQTIYQEEFAKAIVEYQELNESVDDAVEEVLINDEKKKEFNKHARVVNTLYKAILPDPSASKYLPIRSALKAIADKIKILEPFQPDDISGIEAKIEEKLDQSIISAGYTIEYNADLIDIGKIDFAQLKERFNKKKHKRVELEKIKTNLKEQIEQMVDHNRTRMDFKERFEEMIEKYNNYSINVDLQLEELFDLAKDLNAEGERHAKENMTEEELAIFDIVTQREKIELNTAERKKIKEGVHNLIEKLKQEKLVQDWKKQQRYISDVKVTIEQEFDSILPDAYDRRLFTSTVNEVFDHVYQSY